MDNPFGITKEELIELTANKVADNYAEDLHGAASRQLRERIDEIIKTEVKDKIDAVLTVELQKLLTEEIVPVNIWGEREGQPTTIRAELARRAKDFWTMKIDDRGRESSYGGNERCKVLMEQILKDTFNAAVKANAEVIISEFKAALKADTTKLITAHIDKLITVR